MRVRKIVHIVSRVWFYVYWTGYVINRLGDAVAALKAAYEAFKYGEEGREPKPPTS
jgi:hypothetical protein